MPDEHLTGRVDLAFALRQKLALPPETDDERRARLEALRAHIAKVEAKRARELQNASMPSKRGPKTDDF